MKPSAIASEAWRNIRSGTTHAALWAILFLLVSGTAVGIDGAAVATITKASTAFHAAGGSTFVVQAPGAISAARCEALSSLDRIQSSAAIRSTEPIFLSALPSTPTALFEATAGVRQLLHAGGDGRTGLLLSEQLASQLAVGPSSTLALTEPTSSTNVLGVFDYPSDGRMSWLSSAAIAVVPTTGLFDECWIDIWPSTSSTDALALFAVSGAASDTGDTAIRQLNSTLGRSFDTSTLIENRSTRFLAIAGIFAAALLGYIAVRSRRLELASAMHAGVTRGRLVIQILVESASWLLAAMCAVVPLVYFIAAQTQVAGDTSLILGIEVRVLISQLLAAGTGVLLSLGLIRETHLFTYFKDR